MSESLATLFVEQPRLDQVFFNYEAQDWLKHLVQSYFRPTIFMSPGLLPGTKIYPKQIITALKGSLPLSKIVSDKSQNTPQELEEGPPNGP